MYTYERDDGTARSWIDHVLCSRTCSSLISDVYIYFAFRLHIIRPFPIVLSIKANCTPRPTSPFNYSKSHRVNWSKVSHSDIEKYNDNMVSQSISSLPPEVVNCSLPHCTIHQDVLDSYSQYLVFTLLTCAFLLSLLLLLENLLAGLIPLPISRKQPIFGISYGMMLVVHHQVYYFNYKEKV